MKIKKYLILKEKRNTIASQTGAHTHIMALTLCKLRRIVIHITEGNCHCCSSRESTHMSSHVLCLDDHKIFFFGFSVHVGKSCFNYSYNSGGEKQSVTDTNSVCSCFYGYMQILVSKKMSKVQLGCLLIQRINKNWRF